MKDNNVKDILDKLNFGGELIEEELEYLKGYITSLEKKINDIVEYCRTTDITINQFSELIKMVEGDNK